MKRFPNGSDWRKWDLHVHTPQSSLENQYGTDWDAYLSAIEAFGDEIAVMGATDYCTITGYERLLAYRAKGRIANIEAVFPNIEFRITPETQKDKGVNIHLIINPEDVGHVNKIKHALGRLHFRYDGQNYSCSDQQLTDLGIAVAGPSSPERNLRDGINQFKPSFDAFEDWLRGETWLRDNAIIIASNSSGDGISGLRDNGLLAVRQNIYRLVDAIFSGNPQDCEYFQGRGSDSRAEVIRKYGKLLPCFHGSDAHGLTKIFRPNQDRFCWIKADPTFAGLKQVLFDHTRVRIQNTSPNTKTPYQYIKHVRFTDRSGQALFSDQPVHFSPDLNAIIGGKSSGKSLLLYHMASAINASEVSEKMKISGQAVYDDLNSLDVDVTWGNGEVSSLHDDETRPVTYIPQLYINHLAERSGQIQLNQLVEEILYQNNTFKVFAVENAAQREASIRAIKTRIDYLTELRKKYSECGKEMEKYGTEKAVSDEIRRQEERIAQLRKQASFTPDEEIQYLTLRQRTDSLHSRRRALDDLTGASSSLKESLERYAGSSIQSLTDQLRLDSPLPDNSSFLEKSLRQLEASLAAAVSDFICLHEARFDSIPAMLKRIDTENAARQETLLPLSVKITDQETLKAATAALEKENEKLRQLQQLSERRKSILQEGNDTKNQLQTEYARLTSLYLAYVAELSKPEYHPEGEISVTARISFNAEKFDRFTGCFDRRGNINLLLGDLTSAKGGYAFSVDRHADTIASIYERYRNGGVAPTLRKGIEDSDILNYLYDDCYLIDFSVRYRGDDIVQMSPGKRGLVLLNLILHLSNSRHPILIDQPEDNLDNRTIYSQLNDFVRQRKADRQIIMVTHNANLVVGTDAECVIVSNQSGQRSGIENSEFRFEYYTGSLECSFTSQDDSGRLHTRGIREHVCEILEGGIQAFKERERKYGL
ncbi:TrlF family AAA-like ATPase [Pantoea dispersa]|uniref:TrlF family AAA-like ATPase n=1 Tax=Pantoea dispersa TaxID=59814 RepID=UPI0032B420D5